jgi:deoxyribonuclease V
MAEEAMAIQDRLRPLAVGRALRTQTGVRPVFVPVGHRADLDTACAITLRLSRRHRVPETTRRSDRLSRRTLTGR